MVKKCEKRAEAERWAQWVLDELRDDPKDLAIVISLIESLAERARSRRRV